MEPGNNNNGNSSDLDVPKPVINDSSDNESIDNTVENVQNKTKYFKPQFGDIIVGQFVLDKVRGRSRKKTVYRYAAVLQ